MMFYMIICYTHVTSRHLELIFLNLMHIDRPTQMIEKKNHFCLQPIAPKFEDFEIFILFIYS
jgi:hypothetical protein